MSNWIVGLGLEKHSYKIGDVTYVVSPHFAKPTKEDKLTFSDRVKNFIGGDFAELTTNISTNRISNEYVCSAAGKEDTCSRKIKN